MGKNIKHHIIILIEIIILSIIVVSCNISNTSNNQAINGENTKVTFFDAGKADCILIENKDCAILIDTGYDDNKEEIVKELLKRNVKSLEYLILTHPDKDHMAALVFTHHILRSMRGIMIIP